MCILTFSRAYRADGGMASKKEQGSYGKALSSQYFRAHQQHHDHIFVAPGHQGVEFLTAHGSRAEKWQAHRDPCCHFCSGSETLPGRHVWGRELGAQPPSGGRSTPPHPLTAQRKYTFPSHAAPEPKARRFGEMRTHSPPAFLRDLSQTA